MSLRNHLKSLMGGRSGSPLLLHHDTEASTSSDIPYSPSSLTSADAIVHLEYDPAQIPAKPTQDGSWTRFICISDTHSRTFNVPDGDVLLHSGDLTPTGSVEHFKRTMEWLYKLPHAHKIIIAGNHDLPLHNDWYETNHDRWHTRGKQPLEPILDMLKGDKAKRHRIVYLQDERYEFRVDGRTWSVYGSPWSPEFFNWAFNYTSDEAEGIISRLPPTDILLTHGPPYKVFDRVKLGDNVGCQVLARRLPQLRPRLHVFGHIHEAHGAQIVDWDTTPDLANFVDDTEWDVSSDVTIHSAGSANEDIAMELQPKEPSGFTTPSETTSATDENTASGGRFTVFANAANWPSGARASRDGARVPFAGPGFQPIIVDLRN
ncbi:hypothetical protein PC9H_000098 [Pleurotus ostreatus]|uniref:Calcineurin-like phosphoesterase domain-containing protein n=1 Tax=Pleurotus ostreatus TaxID=5322 RepID=A0A8H7DWB2_PLEOS|nr:uncharacterized protein PC9H_000098 [Pleurotus ostreatus]KAF7439762.1 hypothetical protein PC9H_000098 [Pleurotus ostreatus]